MTLTDAEAAALGRRARACKGWRWTLTPGPGRGAGVLTMAGNRILWDHGPDTPFIRGTPLDEVRGSEVPDLRDPASLGQLFALVEEVWNLGTRIDDGSRWLSLEGSGEKWGAVIVDGLNGPTRHFPEDGCAPKAAVLVAMLEAAP